MSDLRSATGLHAGAPLTGALETDLPRSLPKGLALAFIIFAFFLLFLTYVIASPIISGVTGALAFLVMGLGADVESISNARRRARSYAKLGIPILAPLASAMRWHFGPADVVALLLAGYFMTAAVNAVRPLPEWLMVGALVVVVVVLLGGALVWLQRRAIAREAEIEAVARLLDLELAEVKSGRDRQFVLRGEHAGRQVQVGVNGYSRVVVLVEEGGDDGLWVGPATRQSRRATRQAARFISLGVPAFDQHFLVEGVPEGRVRSFLDEPELRERLLLLGKLARLELLISGNGLQLVHRHPRADGPYLQMLVSTAASMARRWDGHEVLDFADEASTRGES